MRFFSSAQRRAVLCQGAKRALLGQSLWGHQLSLGTSLSASWPHLTSSLSASISVQAPPRERKCASDSISTLLTLMSRWVTCELSSFLPRHSLFMTQRILLKQFQRCNFCLIKFIWLLFICEDSCVLHRETHLNSKLAQTRLK